ncbi:coiled-coil domain-containing protein R3HCC1L, partial [Neocloeon triangulifer]|uniref:coiled-coil domain-containing protein R3HCC1L n=1 Tax=Neocloeon triangulifer TaxID=2078957 RepID=UPI00286F26C2
TPLVPGKASKLENFGARYLTLEDSCFLDLVIFDVETFRKASDDCQRVLLFPAVNNYRRFLIHKTVEQFPELKTFSVGEGYARRTVVCFVKQSERQALISLRERETAMAATETKKTVSSKPMPVVGIYQPPAMRAARNSTDNENGDSASINSGSRLSKSKRPDLQVYVPRARRQAADSPPECAAQTTPSPPKASKIRNASPNVVTPRKKSATKTNNKGLGSKSQSCDSDTSSCDLLEDNSSFIEEEKAVAPVTAILKEPTVCKDKPEVTNETVKGVEKSEEECVVFKGDVSSESDVVEESEETETIAVPRATELIQSATPSLPKFVPQDLGAEGDSWDAMFDDNGDCLDPKIMDELTKTVGKVKIDKPASDYRNYEEAREKLLAESDYSHVLEVFGFPAEFKTPDLVAVLNPFAGRSGFDLKWVDDTHALAIFSNSLIAAEVLSMNHNLFSVRPLSQASAESKSKAKKCPQTLRPYRPRPETCSAMAKRLVSSALGVRLTTTKEEREKEKNLLKEAREKKRLAVKQSQDAWEGTISSFKS